LILLPKPKVPVDEPGAAPSKAPHLVLADPLAPAVAILVEATLVEATLVVTLAHVLTTNQALSSFLFPYPLFMAIPMAVATEVAMAVQLILVLMAAV
jgi:hypothetical protein